MRIAVSVALYDVVTTAVPPRLVVTCRTPEAQLDLATRLGKMRADALTSGADSSAGAVPPNAVFGGSVLRINTYTGAAHGYASHEIIRAVAGVQSLATMQEF